MSKVFEAKWRGICAACDQDIEPGAEVCYEDNDLIHIECRAPTDLDVTRAEEKSPFRKPRHTPPSVCPVCSLEHVGECL